MNEDERDELRSSLGLPRTYVEHPDQSAFLNKVQRYIDDLPVDDLTKPYITGLLWPVTLFYLMNTLVGAIVLEIVFIALIIFQGWPIYFVAALAAGIGAQTYGDFRQYNLFVRYGFWATCVIVLIYFIYPFDVRAHERNIKATSTHITDVIFPTFEKTAEYPRIFLDNKYARSRDDFYGNYDVKAAFYAEFAETCKVGLEAAADGAGKLIWKERFDKIEFVLSSGESIPFTDCDDFSQSKLGELTAKFEATWDKPKSIDAWGRFDFVGEGFSDADAPRGTFVEVLFSDPEDGVNFEVVASFELKSDWYGEVEIPVSKPVLAKLYMKAQNGLPETTSKAVLVEPELK
jgi:hypothetical protein